MQDRFVGDIGDFGKYGLLRALTGLWDWERGGPLPECKRLSLGVVWCVPDTEIAGTSDGHGQNVSYLFNEMVKSRFQRCDPALFNAMKNTVCNIRNLQEIERSQILGLDTIFYNAPIPLGTRKQWIDDAVSHTSKAKIVFLDPDVGVADPEKDRAPKQTSYRRKDASQYVFLSEISKFMQGKTVIIYQSFGRKISHLNQMKKWEIQLRKEFPQVSPCILKFNSQSPRAFIILPAAQHADLIDERLAKMLAGPWKQHFERYAGG